MTNHKQKDLLPIYPGYIYQLYAQYFCLEDMGYTVKSLKLHSLDDNKNYAVAIPGDDPALLARFEELLQNIRAFDLRAPFQANPNKCKHCIYNNLCDEVESC